MTFFDDTPKFGEMVRVAPLDGSEVASGKLLEIDSENVVIETKLGYEEVFRRAKVRIDKAAIRRRMNGS